MQVALAASCGKPVWPIVESARGLANLAEIAHAQGVERLSFGALDLGLDLGLANGSAGAERMLTSTLCAAAAVAIGRAGSTAGQRLSRHQEPRWPHPAAAGARDMGFGGLLCIHPSQVAVVHETLMPSAAELDWAQRILAAGASGDGVFVVDGQMVDAPVIGRARHLLQRAGQAVP